MYGAISLIPMRIEAKLGAANALYLGKVFFLAGKIVLF